MHVRLPIVGPANMSTQNSLSEQPACALTASRAAGFVLRCACSPDSS